MSSVGGGLEPDADIERGSVRDGRIAGEFVVGALTNVGCLGENNTAPTVLWDYIMGLHHGITYWDYTGKRTRREETVTPFTSSQKEV